MYPIDPLHHFPRNYSPFLHISYQDPPPFVFEQLVHFWVLIVACYVFAFCSVWVFLLLRNMEIFLRFVFAF